MDASKQAERSTGPRPEQDCKVERRAERELCTPPFVLVLVKLVMVILSRHASFHTRGRHLLGMWGHAHS